jgi:hypothetical protein
MSNVIFRLFGQSSQVNHTRKYLLDISCSPSAMLTAILEYPQFTALSGPNTTNLFTSLYIYDRNTNLFRPIYVMHSVISNSFTATSFTTIDNALNLLRHPPRSADFLTLSTSNCRYYSETSNPTQFPSQWLSTAISVHPRLQDLNYHEITTEQFSATSPSLNNSIMFQQLFETPVPTPAMLTVPLSSFTLSDSDSDSERSPRASQNLIMPSFVTKTDACTQTEPMKQRLTNEIWNSLISSKDTTVSDSFYTFVMSYEALPNLGFTTINNLKAQLLLALENQHDRQQNPENSGSSVTLYPIPVLSRIPNAPYFRYDIISQYIAYCHTPMQCTSILTSNHHSCPFVQACPATTILSAPSLISLTPAYTLLVSSALDYIKELISQKKVLSAISAIKTIKHNGNILTSLSMINSDYVYERKPSLPTQLKSSVLPEGYDYDYTTSEIIYFDPIELIERPATQTEIDNLVTIFNIQL